MPDMQKVLATKEKILQVIKEKGPELPVRVAKAIEQNNLFTAAFMSELVGEQRLKISNMKVGGSPLYYISGQEEQLQKYIDFLNHKEKEAFNLLKQNEVLKDSELEPAIRVALRSIKDFAVQIKIIDKEEEKLFWKIHTLSNEKAKDLISNILNPIKPKEKEEIKETIEGKKEETKTEEKEPKEEIKKIIEETKTEEKEVKKQVKEKESKEITSPFLDNLKKTLKDKNYIISKEILLKKKELTAKIKIKTLFGEQEFYLVAKDKKKITLEDIVSTLQKAQAEKMPALIMSKGDIDKKALDYYREWSNLINHQKII